MLVLLRVLEAIKSPKMTAPSPCTLPRRIERVRVSISTKIIRRPFRMSDGHGSAPGEYRGGRQKGTKNKATIEQEKMISRAMGKLDRPLGKDVLAEVMVEFREMAKEQAEAARAGDKRPGRSASTTRAPWRPIRRTIGPQPSPGARGECRVAGGKLIAT